LFELAGDSPGELDSYIDAGRLLVAVQGDEVVGHVQLIETGRPSEAEMKIMAVLSPLQRRGVGRALVAAAIDIARDEGRSTLIVATATADIGNLRFYQRVGFRMSAIERDAFTEASGYVRACTSTASRCAIACGWTSTSRRNTGQTGGTDSHALHVPRFRGTALAWTHHTLLPQSPATGLSAQVSTNPGELQGSLGAPASRCVGPPVVTVHSQITRRGNRSWDAPCDPRPGTPLPERPWAA
jgi:N-acetylglutamate synthase-like GNAT family acetyltransferase